MEFITLTNENLEQEHICCAIGDKKHQAGVESKKEWIKSKLHDGHVFRKLDARGKIFIEYEPIETAWVPIIPNMHFCHRCKIQHFQELTSRIPYKLHQIFLLTAYDLKYVFQI